MNNEQVMDAASDNNNEEAKNESKNIDASLKEDFMSQSLEEIETEKKEIEQGQNNYTYNIVINGADSQNIAVNTGSILGNLSQGDNNQNKKSIESIQDVQKMITAGQDVDKIQMLIILSVLQVVPANYFLTLLNELKQCWKVNEEESKMIDPYLSVGQCMDELGAERVSALFYDESGKSEFICYRLNDQTMAILVKHFIWNDYQMIRDYILKWLFRIVQIKKCRGMVIKQVSDAFGEFAVMDYSYAKLELIPLLLNQDTRDAYYFLEHIFKILLESDNYKENIWNIMKHWVTSGNDAQRNLIYKLYRAKRDEAVKPYIIKSMRKIIHNDINNGKEILDKNGFIQRIIFFKYDHINYRILQDNEDIAALYVCLLSDMFQVNDGGKNQLYYGYYLCHLFFKDYYYEGNPNHRMFLINVMANKDIRKQIKPIYLFVWQKKRFRNYLEKPINNYLYIVHKKNCDWEYTKYFFRTLAFTGNAQDFYNMESFLTKMEKQGNILAGNIKRYMNELKESRISDRRGKLQ